MDEPYSCLVTASLQSSSSVEGSILIVTFPLRDSLLCRCDMSCPEEAREGTRWADKEAAIRFCLSAGHACFELKAAPN